MLRRSLGSGLLPVLLLPPLLLLTSCDFVIGGAGGDVVQDARLQHLGVGMTTDEAVALLGRPWQIVVDAMGGDRQVYRYRMEPVKYEEEIRVYDEEANEHVRGKATRYQTRIVELTFVAGKLVKEH